MPQSEQWGFQAPVPPFIHTEVLPDRTFPTRRDAPQRNEMPESSGHTRPRHPMISMSIVTSGDDWQLCSSGRMYALLYPFDEQ